MFLHLSGSPHIPYPSRKSSSHGVGFPPARLARVLLPPRAADQPAPSHDPARGGQATARQCQPPLRASPGASPTQPAMPTPAPVVSHTHMPRVVKEMLPRRVKWKGASRPRGISLSQERTHQLSLSLSPSLSPTNSRTISLSILCIYMYIPSRQ